MTQEEYNKEMYDILMEDLSVENKLIKILERTRQIKIITTNQ